MKNIQYIPDTENNRLLKTNRLEKLKQTNAICEVCSKKANTLHHVDYSKTNHDLSNLIIVCRKCHASFHAKEKGIRKRKKHYGLYWRKYGYSIPDVCRILGWSKATVWDWFQDKQKRKLMLEMVKLEESCEK